MCWVQMAYTRWITKMHVLALPNRAKLKKICIRAQLAYTPGLSYSTYTVQYSTVQYMIKHRQIGLNTVNETLGITEDIEEGW